MSKKTKKYFNATLATAVAASGVAAVAPAATEASSSFADVKTGDYFYQDVLDLQARGIIKGFEDGSFRPNQAVTRGQAAKILAGVLGLDTVNVKDPGFKDVPKTNEYYGAIAALANAGIINGFEDGTFRQGQPVLRNHMAKMIARGFNLQVAEGATTPLTDVHADYEQYVTALYTNKVTTGRTATTFDGTSNVTRGQLVAFVARAEKAKSTTSTDQKAEQQFTVESVTATTIKTSAGDYTVSTAMQSIFKEANAAALKGAQVVAQIENNEIVSVKALTITAKTPGTFDANNATIAGNVTVKSADVKVVNVKVQGKLIVDEVAVAPVASLTAIAADEKSVSTITLENVTAQTIEVKRDEVTLSSKTKLANVVVASTVKTIEVNAPVAKLSLEASATVTVKGTATIDELVVAEKAKVTIDAATKVTKLVIPAGVKVEDVVTNYNDIKANITSVVEEKAATTGPSYSGGSGGGYDDDDDDDDNDDNSTYVVNPIVGEKITAAGTYGLATGNRVIEGDVTITVADVTLQNVTVKGNLILGEGIGEGDVRLKGVKVEGETRVNGGGKNSVYFEDSVLATVIVNKNNGAVRIVAQGSTRVVEVQLETPTLVVERDLDAGSTGFEDVIVTEAMQTAGEGIQVQLEGVFETINSRATNVRMSLSESTDIRTLVLNALAHISGTGTIQIARINANGSTISQRPQNVVLDISGHVDVTIAGESVTESYSDPNATAVVSAIRASQGVISVDMDNFIADLTAGDFEVTATLDGQEITLNNLSYEANKQRFTYSPVTLVGNIGKTVEVTVTPKHDKLSTAAVTSSFEVATGFNGRITDIQGAGIPNLTIKFRAGSGTTTGEVVAEATTDAYGYYTVNVPEGIYTGEFSAPGYLTTYMIASAPADFFNTEQNETVMRAAASQEVKIMLTWDEHPRDLDSHLKGPSAEDSDFHIYYGHKQATVNGIVYADLDWDDVDSYGPETTTIRQLVDGEYRFYVHHFSGYNTLRTSGAKVHVFLGNATTPTQVFEVPTGEGDEIYWNVFDLIVSDNGETVTIRPVNTLEQIRMPEMLTDLTRARETIYNQYNMSFDILETAEQSVKIAAVQQFIDTLTFPTGVTATVSVTEYGQYIVTLEKDGETLVVDIYPTFQYDPTEQETNLEPIEFTFDEAVATADIATIDVESIKIEGVTTADIASVTTGDSFAINFKDGVNVTATSGDTITINVTDPEGNRETFIITFDGTAWVARRQAE